MRFSRYPRVEVFEWTKRKLTLAERRPQRQAMKLASNYPLIASVLEPPQAFDLERETESRRLAYQRSEQRMRAFHARIWRESRKNFFLASDAQRALIRSAWLEWRGPTTSTYFRYLVDLHTGVMKARSERFRAAEKQRRLSILALSSSQLQIQ